jgi:tetratricopeptide (TPR) repeat protein
MRQSVRGAAVGYFVLTLLALLSRAELASADAPPTKQPVRTSVVCLEANQAQPEERFSGNLTHEIFRQAVLIAARDEMGIPTRDADLREWLKDPPAFSTLRVDFSRKDVLLVDPSSNSTLWRTTLPDPWEDDLLGAPTDSAEKLSRNEFPALLRKQGWSGNPNASKPGALAPYFAEDHLGEMEELSQFTVLRETHEAIRSRGESLPRLGALVRAYANLGQLTRYHWSTEYAVYAARSLLYAQRMVAANPDSAFALWHRAYARALSGFQGGALADLAAAAQKRRESAPAWVALLDPFCRYQTGKLVQLAASDRTLTPLGSYLAFLTAERSGCQGAVMSVAQAAMTQNPRCLRIIDAMCSNTGPGMLNELVEVGPQTFSLTLGAKVEKLPRLPDVVLDVVKRVKRPGGNPSGREEVCQALIAQGAPELDTTEPSWAALGRLIQETTFAQCQRKANLISEKWGVDASDYTAQVAPLIDRHPFKYLIAAYGLRHHDNDQAVRDAMGDLEKSYPHITLASLPLYDMEYWLQSGGPGTSDKLWQRILRSCDCNSIDNETLALRLNLEQFEHPVESLRKLSPDSPLILQYDIQFHWDAEKAKQWESNHGDYPTVALALGRKYKELKQWDDAVRCLRKYVSVSPDKDGYEELAGVYWKEHKQDQWLATLNEFIAFNSSYGLEQAQVQNEIAYWYMNKGDFKDAVPYADAAGGTASAWGILCSANAHTGIGDFAFAEQQIKDEIDHYSDSPYTWFEWCQYTDHGDKAGATAAMHAWFDSHAGRMQSEDLEQLACMQMLEKNLSGALATFQKRLLEDPGPVSALHIAIIADGMGDTAMRDAALARIEQLPENNSPYGFFASALRDAIKAGPTAKPDFERINAIMASCDLGARITFTVLLYKFLEHRSDTADAVRYLHQEFGIVGSYADEMLLFDEMRAQGLDPMAIFREAAAKHQDY